MRCPNCNQEVDESLNYCSYCGEELHKVEENNPSTNDYFPGKYKKDYVELDNEATMASPETLNLLFLIPGIIMPLLGIGIYFYIKRKKPLNASLALKGAFLGMGINLLLLLI